MTDPILIAITAAFVGASAGYLGSFMVIKRMSLVGDALSHVALPGIAIALLLNLPPIIGALVALTLAVVGIWYIQRKSSLYPEALVGIVFTVSLAIGILITPEPELLEALFGDLTRISVPESLIAILVSLQVIVTTFFISRQLILGTVSEELAKSTGISNSKVSLYYYLLIGIIIAVGIKFSGTLLVGALVIIPAVAAQNISRNLTGYYLLSLFFGLFAALVGTLFASSIHVPPGPVIVLLSGALFAATLIMKLLIARHPLLEE